MLYAVRSREVYGHYNDVTNLEFNDNNSKPLKCGGIVILSVEIIVSFHLCFPPIEKGKVRNHDVFLTEH